MTSYPCVMTRYSYCSPDAGPNGEILTESFTRLLCKEDLSVTTCILKAWQESKEELLAISHHNIFELRNLEISFSSHK